MGNSPNILAEIISSENEVTRFLYALSAYPLFRNELIGFLTNGKFGAEHVDWEDMFLQQNIGGVRPDLSVLNEKLSLLVEVKTSLYTQLTDAQPEIYLDSLSGSQFAGERILVVFLPRCYRHLAELRDRISAWRNKNQDVIITICFWEDLLSRLDKCGLPSMNTYINDFYRLLHKWFEKPILRLKYEEIEVMYKSETARGIKAILNLIKQVQSELEKTYQVNRSFNKEWWNNGEFGFYVQINNLNVLWFGLWQAYWEKNAVPLCFGVDTKWDDRLTAGFRQLHKKIDTMDSYLLSNIEQHILLSDDRVGKITALLEDEIKALSSLLSSVSEA
ncbi:MAG: hypothetical protein PHW74_03035 [Desulfobacca sp.]|nr:hypothetical protein [Desulfobacca sp.]